MSLIATLHPSTPVGQVAGDETPIRIIGILEHGRLDGSPVMIRMDHAEAGRLAALILNTCGVGLGDAPGQADQVSAVIENLSKALELIKTYAGSQTVPADQRDTGWARVYALCTMALEGKVVPRG